MSSSAVLSTALQKEKEEESTFMEKEISQIPVLRTVTPAKEEPFTSIMEAMVTTAILQIVLQITMEVPSTGPETTVK